MISTLSSLFLASHVNARVERVDSSLFMFKSPYHSLSVKHNVTGFNNNNYEHLYSVSLRELCHSIRSFHCREDQKWLNLCLAAKFIAFNLSLCIQFLSWWNVFSSHVHEIKRFKKYKWSILNIKWFSSCAAFIVLHKIKHLFNVQNFKCDRRSKGEIWQCQ